MELTNSNFQKSIKVHPIGKVMEVIINLIAFVVVLINKETISIILRLAMLELYWCSSMGFDCNFL